jgi:hypothetical protein
MLKDSFLNIRHREGRSLYKTGRQGKGYLSGQTAGRFYLFDYAGEKQ